MALPTTLHTGYCTLCGHYGLMFGDPSDAVCLVIEACEQRTFEYELDELYADQFETVLEGLA